MAEAVKQEQTEGETVSLDNMKDLKGKKGANLIVKILAMVLMPMLVIIFFAMLALKAVGNNTAETLVKEELAATEYAMQLNLDSASVMRTAVSARARSILQRIRAFSRISRAIPT